MPLACRLGIATRGNTHPTSDDILEAFEQGINYWNWCGHEDGMSDAIQQLATNRSKVILAAQLETSGWNRDAMWQQLETKLQTLKTDYLDVVTLYYVESQNEWNEINRPSGALQALQEAKEQGLLRAIGLTTHQRRLAAQGIQTGVLDVLMIRYNAAHRGAEDDIFPVSDRLGLPVVCFTCLRWGALLKATNYDPSDFQVPSAPEWYRFVLSNPSVSIALMAPNNRDELLENLTLLKNWKEIPLQRRQELTDHGDRVRTEAGQFP